MAKQKRKPAKGKPITSHQLFPAVVALWFGALFGLGSLAVRPSLLENLVLRSHLDLVVPSAAPPLGVTARILVALVMAALGAVIGMVLAHRLARPKPISTERKRTSQDLGRTEPAASGHYADASTRPPVLSRGELEESGGTHGGGLLANRRRALAIEPEEEVFVPHEMAPLPGGNPQVFDISELSIGSGPAAGHLPSVAEAHLQPSAPQPAPVALDWSNAAPVATPTAPIPAPSAIEAQRQQFQAGEPAAPPELCPASAQAHAEGRQVFGMTPPPAQPEAQRQIFGMTATEDHVPQEFVEAAGFKTTVFQQDPVQPLFAPREAAVSQAPVPQACEPVIAATVAAVAPDTFAPPAVQTHAQAQPATPLAAEPATVPQVAASPDQPLPSPASLGMTDLAARLAELMRRRRAARAAAAVPAAPVETASLTPPATETQPPAALPPEPAPFTAPPIPAAYEPALAAEPVAPVPVPLPRAMQPLALDAFLGEDALPDPSLLPPRHIVMPAAPPLASPVPSAISPIPAEPAPLELSAREALPEEPAEQAVSEDAFGSLLEISPARNPFVRIEEAEPEAAAIEPVVIFPGQAPVQPAPFAQADAPAPFRRFDGAAAAGQGQPVAASNTAPAVDSTEAERALRAALSNLQRMSGAA